MPLPNNIPARLAGPLLATAISIPCGLVAQQNALGLVDLREDTGVATAVPAEPSTPVLDGRLDEAAWQAAPPHGGFRQRDPEEGAPATEPTEFRVVYSPSAIYIGVRAYDSKPADISAILARRDDRTPADRIEVMIDSYRDRLTGYLFSVNAAGVKRDAYLYNDTREDDNWDAVWEVATAIDSLGWVAEFRIPLSQLRFASSEVTTVGFNVSRRVARLNEEQYWRLVPKTASGVVSRFGDLGGMQVSPARRLEVQPYTVARLERSAVQPGNPFAGGTRQGATFGTDVRVGITSALSLTATINPDFGQVEADPAEVNLTAFETFQRERRPFFTEGLDQFQSPVGGRVRFGGREGLFYSRRIGRSPQGRAASRGGFAEPAGQTTILGAAKLTGKLPSGWTIGLMTALTDLETSSVVDSIGARHEDMVEPRTGYAVARIARDFRDGQTVVGAFGTTVQRDLDPSLDFLHSAAYTGGFDVTHRFRRNTYRLTARAVGSRVQGSAEAIDRTQRSSARYLQRPDRADGLYDPTRTSLSGYGLAVGIEKQGGGNWRWNAGIERRSPGLELNDIGFLQRADRTYQWAGVSYNWFRPGRVFRSFTLDVSQSAYWTHAWERRSVGGEVTGRFTLRNYWSGWVNLEYEGGGVLPEALRGGPAMRNASSTSVNFNLRTDSRKTIRAGGGAFMNFENETPSWRASLRPSISWRPSAGVDLEFQPGITFNRNTWQYLGSPTVNASREYVFGDLRQRTVSMEFRGSVTFSPTLTLQLYAEPFVSSGTYGAFSRVVAPRAERFADQFAAIPAGQVSESDGVLGFDLSADGSTDVSMRRPDFTVLSFTSNAVLRWEYGLGSTLFVVWQHGRSDRYRDGRFDFGARLGDLFRAEAVNVLMVKINYWLNP